MSANSFILTREVWRAIPSAPGYEASSRGRVRSVSRTVTHRNGRSYRLVGRVLTPQPLPSGYLQVFLGASQRGYVHRLVLEAFVGACPEGMEGLHGPGGQADNSPTNLRWGTHAENVADTITAGNKPEQKRTHCPAEHLLSPPNLVLGELPNRKCRACNQAHAWVQRGGDPSQFRSEADARYARLVGEVAA